MNYGVLLTATSASLYGSIGYFGANLMNHGMSVADLLFWRFFFSTLLLLPLIPWVLRGVRISRAELKDIAILLCMGGVFYGGGTAAYFEASKSIGTGLAMVIFFAYPIFVVALSALVKKERVTQMMAASLFLIITGCTLIALGQPFQFDLNGILLGLLSGLGYGIYVFGSKESSQRFSPLFATSVVCIGNTCAFVCYLLGSGKGFFIPDTGNMWLHISLFSLLGTVLPVLLMLAGLKYISANKASVISVLEPVTTLALGAIVLEEAVSGMQFAGAVIILGSALVVQFDKREKIAAVL